MTTTSRSLAERQERRAHVREAASLAMNHVLESVSRERKFAKPRNVLSRCNNESEINDA